jgi:uncharacterized protein (TIGR03435 family)
MYEQICRLVLRLYPRRFRNEFGEESLLFLRDRWRHETGFRLRMQLLLDIFFDTCRSLIHEHAGKESRALPAYDSTSAAPAFTMLIEEGPRPAALCGGAFASGVALVFFAMLLLPGKGTRPSNAFPHYGLGGLGSWFSLVSHLQEQRPELEPAFVKPVETPIAESKAFASIRIKPAQSADARDTRMRVLPNGDLIASGVSIVSLLSYAYDVPANPSPRLSGLSGWRETYDIEAKAIANAIPVGLSEGEKRGRMKAMIRELLVDRFKLVMRVEEKTMPVYALSVAPGGPTLQKAAIVENDCFFDTASPDSCHHFIVARGHPLNARAISLDDLAQYIENWTDLPVVNHTAISGLFTVETEGWIPMRLPPPPPGNAPGTGFDDLPTIFAVLRTVGLDLQRQEGVVPVYTVERIERPAADQ